MTTQEFSNVVALLVALATGWLAWTTARVAKISKEALELQTQPYFAFKGISLTLGRMRDIGAKEFPSAIRIGLDFRNPGKVPVTYQIEHISASLNGADLPLSEVLSKGGRVFPEQAETYFYPVSPLATAPYAGSEAIVEAHVRYWSLPSEPHTLKLKHKVTITSVEPTVSWEWVSIEEPQYDA